MVENQFDLQAFFFFSSGWQCLHWRSEDQINKHLAVFLNWVGLEAPGCVPDPALSPGEVDSGTNILPSKVKDEEAREHKSCLPGLILVISGQCSQQGALALTHPLAWRPFCFSSTPGQLPSPSIRGQPSALWWPHMALQLSRKLFRTSRWLVPRNTTFKLETGTMREVTSCWVWKPCFLPSSEWDPSLHLPGIAHKGQCPNLGS